MCKHKCTCMFVPNHVLAQLAKAGVDGAKLSIHESKKKREERKSNTKKTSTNQIKNFIKEAHPESASREVYDCNNQEQQRVELVRSEGGAVTSDTSANKAYDHIGVVRDYFKTVLNRHSIDNLGMNLILNVHYGNKFMNAFWDGDEMTFGDGDGNIFIDFTQSLDVCAHELTHGVTQYTANLEYWSQSGALNEHFSDVFGTAITQYANGQTAHDADWLIGNEIMGPTLYGEALRSMKAPGTAYDNPLLGKDPQPDHMSKYYSGSGDNQGVHINSGIPNKAFYLTAMEIGTDKAALIWYTALEKLWPSAKFSDAVDVIVNAARQLIFDNKISSGAVQTVRSAFREVGLGTGAAAVGMTPLAPFMQQEPAETKEADVIVENPVLI